MSPISQKPLCMEREHFDQLVKAVHQMNRHMSGKMVPGAIPASDIEKFLDEPGKS